MANYLFNRNTLLVALIMFSFSSQSWSSYLKLGDDEVQNREYARVYRVLNDFFSIHEESIQKLNTQKFFHEENYKEPTPRMKLALAAIQSDKNSCISRGYGSRQGLEKLKTHLRRINSCLRNAPEASDLSTIQVKRLSNYIAALSKLAEALSYGYYYYGK